MKSSSLRDISLYELALSTDNPPHPLQLSPSTFKSLITQFVDLLIDQRISATVWTKLPRGEVWEAELGRLRRSSAAPHTIYTFSQAPSSARTQPPPEPDSEPEMQSQEMFDSISSLEAQLMSAETDALIDDQGIIPMTSTESTRSVFLPIQSEVQLRREYFMLILSDTFSVLVVAHRPRSMRRHSAADPEGSENGSEANPTPEGNDRKHLLLTLCSFDATIIQKVLTGIHLAVGSSTNTEHRDELSTLLDNWETITAPATNIQLAPDILNHLVMQQIQVQENIWHGAAEDRRKAESATSLQLENGELQNALRLKNEFLTNVGQELRTPLSSMKTALTLLESPNMRPPQRQRYMDLLTQECDRQSSLITSVLSLLQLEDTEDGTTLMPINLADVVPGVVSTYQPLAQEKGLMLAYTVPDDLPAVACTTNWIRQIIINLIHNSIKFTQQGGQVWVRAKKQGDYVQIEVRDTGVGISQADIPRVFERFYRGRHTPNIDTSGAGLGLSIVQQLLLRCGGSVAARSKVGEGSTFIVLLEVYQKDKTLDA
ncbi:MAG: ATP-binding protein [Cyanobacteria bacterium J06638_22]